MSNIKNPVFSLEAHGTLGEALTFKKRKGQHIAEKKPDLPYFVTLPSQYQRWLYRDFAHQWTLQSIATQRQYAASGVRFHLTGFQFWMKYHLTNLPNIIGTWRMDERTGSLVQDTSPNSNHGTAFGCTPIQAVIDYGRFFDGVNDRVVITHADSLNIIADFTFMALVHPITQGDSNSPRIFDKGNSYGMSLTNTRRFGIAFYDPFFRNYLSVGPDFNWGQSFHVALTRHRASGVIRYFVDAIEVPGASPGVTGYITPNLVDISIGNRAALNRSFHGTIDHLEFFDRVLAPSEITLHTERSWPHK